MSGYRFLRKLMRTRNCIPRESVIRCILLALAIWLIPLLTEAGLSTPEIILHGQTGYLYDNFDGLVECMARLAQNSELSQQMGLAGWARARELFNTEDCAAKVFEIIQSVMNKT